MMRMTKSLDMDKDIDMDTIAYVATDMDPNSYLNKTYKDVIRRDKAKRMNRKVLL